MALKDKKYKSRNLIQSFKYAINGLVTGFKKERNIKVDFFVACVVIIFGFVFSVSMTEWAVLVLCFTLVLSLEYVNTAIESVVDLASPEINPLAKVSKDVAAGAVLFSAINAVVIGIIIFLPKFIDLF